MLKLSPNITVNYPGAALSIGAALPGRVGHILKPGQEKTAECLSEKPLWTIYQDPTLLRGSLLCPLKCRVICGKYIPPEKGNQGDGFLLAGLFGLCGVQFYFNPSFLPCARRRIASLRRRSCVSLFLAARIHRT
jgi:hypothetical protein